MLTKLVVEYIILEKKKEGKMITIKFIIFISIFLFVREIIIQILSFKLFK